MSLFTIIYHLYSRWTLLKDKPCKFYATVDISLLLPKIKTAFILVAKNSRINFHLNFMSKPNVGIYVNFFFLGKITQQKKKNVELKSMFAFSFVTKRLQFCRIISKKGRRSFKWQHFRHIILYENSQKMH